MIKVNKILKSALFISALFLVSPQSYSQNGTIELLPGSKTMEFDEVTGIHRLLDNVHFIYEGINMYCDSAHYFQRKKTVRAYGHVHMNKQDTLNLFCDSLLYNSITKKATLWGNVRVRDREYKLTTDTLHYNTKKSQAHYRHGGRVESIINQEVLTSRVGYFYPNSKNFFFSKNVEYNREKLTIKTDTLQYLYSEKKVFFYGPTYITSDSTKMYCESGWYNTENEIGSLMQNAWLRKDSDYISGDTLVYNRPEQFFIGKGDVFYLDSTAKIEFNAEYLYSSDSLNYSYLTGDAIATKYLKDDTLYLHADTLFINQIDSNDVIKAYHDAKMFATNMQCIADSITFNTAKEIVTLEVSPIVWSKGAELKGEFINMHVSDSLIHQINIINDATILMEVEADLYYNQIAGRKIVANFNDNDLTSANVFGNAITIFFPVEEIKTDSTVTKSRKGMRRLYASDIRIDIDSNEISGITYLDEPDGVFYPMDKIKTEEQFIKNFNWRVALRPISRENLIEKE